MVSLFAFTGKVTGDHSVTNCVQVASPTLVTTMASAAVRTVLVSVTSTGREAAAVIPVQVGGQEPTAPSPRCPTLTTRRSVQWGSLDTT